MKTEFGQRLKTARNHAGMTQKELAQKVGLGQSTIAELEKSGYGSSHVPVIAQTLRVSALWLANGTGEMLDPNLKQPIPIDANPDYPSIRRVRFKLSAGASGFGIDHPANDQGNPIVFRRQWFEANNLDPDKLFAISVINASMEPGLYDGDTVVVNTAQVEPKDGRVFAANYEGELVIKRMVRDNGQWWLASDNPDAVRYPRKVCHAGVSIIGEVIHKQSERI